MKSAWTIAIHEYRAMVRRRLFLVLTLLFPLLGLLAILGVGIVRGIVEGEEAQDLQWGYVDQTDSLLGEQRAGQVVFSSLPSLESALAALQENDIRGYVVIPSNYLTTGVVTAYTTNKGLTFTDEVRGPLRTLLVEMLLQDVASPQVIQRVDRPVTIQTIRLDETGQPLAENLEEQIARLVFFTALAVLLMIAIFMSSGFLIQSIGEEKENRIMEILLSSVAPSELLLGKITGLGGAGLTQVVVWVASALLLLQLAVRQFPVLAGLQITPPLWMVPVGLVLFLLGFLLFATMMAGLGAVTTSSREGQQISSLFVVPAVLGIEANALLWEQPDNILVRVLSFFPLTSPFAVMQRLAVGNIAWWELLLSVGILGLTVVGTVWIATRLFRTYLLMYGRRPRFREVWATLRT